MKELSGSININIYVCVCVCVCNCLPVRGVCPNYEVMEFQPQTLTPPKPSIRLLLLHSYYLLVLPSPPVVRCPSGGGQPPPTPTPLPDPTPPPPTFVLSPHRIIFPCNIHIGWKDYQGVIHKTYRVGNIETYHHVIFLMKEEV